jgi:hypothetical protein
MLSLAARAVYMAVAVGMHAVISTQQTCERTAHGSAFKDLSDLRYKRKNIITGIALPFYDLIQLRADLLVKVGRLIRLNQYIALGDKLAQGVIV